MTDDECPPAHLRALSGAAAVVAGHLHTLLGALLSAGTPRGFGAVRIELERRLAGVRRRLEFLDALRTGPDPAADAGGAGFRPLVPDRAGPPGLVAQAAGARRAVDRLWKLDPDPARTLTIQAEIEAAARSGRIVPAGGGQGPLAFHACPWSQVWLVVRPVHLGGQRLEVLTQFAYEVSAAEVRSTGTFVRRIVRGPFVRTGRVGYEVKPA